MPRLYLHVGTAKTGSTSLQYFLADNERRLRERDFTYLCDPNKSYYGWDRSSTHSAHFPIVASFYKETPDFISKEKHFSNERILNDIATDLEAETRNVILSAEHFSSRLLSRENQLQLKKSFGRFEAKIVFYLRPQHEMLVALHDTGVRCGKTENVFFIPSDYTKDGSTNDERRLDGGDGYRVEDIDPHTPFLNYWECIRPWMDVFGRENIIVRDYKSLINDDIRTDFLTTVGISDHDGFAFSKRLNTGHKLFQIETLRRINSWLPAFGTTSHENYVCANKLREIILNAIPPGNCDLADLLSADDRSKLMSLFSPSNSNIDNRFFHPNSSLQGWYTLPDKNGALTDETSTTESLAETVINLSRLIQELRCRLAKGVALTLPSRAH